MNLAINISTDDAGVRDHALNAIDAILSGYSDRLEWSYTYDPDGAAPLTVSGADPYRASQ